MVAFLRCALEDHPLSKAVDGHREHEADEGAQANLIRRWDYQVERYRPFMVHQIVDGEIARRGILRDERIAVERESGLRGRKDPAEVAILLVEHLLRLLSNDRMGDRSVTSWHPPVVRMSRIVLE